MNEEGVPLSLKEPYLIEEESTDQLDKRGIMKFILPSLFGAFIFLFPIVTEDTFNIPLGIITEYFINLLSAWLPIVVVTIITISTLLTILSAVFKPAFIRNSQTLQSLFDVSIGWTITRTVGCIYAYMAYFHTGWSLVYSDITGQVTFGLLTKLIVWFCIAAFLMPYLINFGIMEFVGTLSRKVIRPLFTLPGRSAIDLLASWIGNVNVGVVITREQFENGTYTGREAAAIVTCFSTVSLPFCLVIAEMLGVGYRFPIFYLTIVIAGLVSAIIIPRIPPITKIPNTYYSENSYQEEAPKNVSKVRWALIQAVNQANKSGSFTDQLKQGRDIFLGIAFALMPQVMAIGTTALIIAEYTPVFQIISKPMVPILELMQLPEASAAAPATIIGFIDMFIPAILASSIDAEITRFVIGALSLIQIIYMTEMGTLLLTSKIPIKFWHLLVIFMLRTAISLPIIVLIAHLIY